MIHLIEPLRLLAPKLDKASLKHCPNGSACSFLLVAFGLFQLLINIAPKVLRLKNESPKRFELRQTNLRLLNLWLLLISSLTSAEPYFFWLYLNRDLLILNLIGLKGLIRESRRGLIGLWLLPLWRASWSFVIRNIFEFIGHSISLLWRFLISQRLASAIHGFRGWSFTCLSFLPRFFLSLCFSLLPFLREREIILSLNLALKSIFNLVLLRNLLVLIFHILWLLSI